MPLEQLRLKPYVGLQCALKCHGKYDKHINMYFLSEKLIEKLNKKGCSVSLG